MLLLDLTIWGDPVPKGRPRFTGHHAYTPSKTRKAQDAIVALAQEKMAEPCDKPVGITMTFYTATRRRTDGDNLQKLVLDALNTICFVDDYLVEEAHWRLHRKCAGELPRTEVTIYTLDSPSPTRRSHP